MESKRPLTILALVGAFGLPPQAHADEARNEAVAGALADCATTFVAVDGYKLTEGNRLLASVGSGVLLACGLKPLGIYIAEQQPEPERTQTLTTQSAVWSGAGANNGVLIAAKALHAAGVLRSAATGPWGYVAGLGVAYYVWRDTAPEREFAAICAAQRRDHPAIECKYERPA